MFTGIIQAIGHITSLETLGDGLRLTINALNLDLSRCHLGDSIAINGACMTVVALAPPFFSVDVSAHSLSRTCGLDHCHAVNLESALRVGDALGGHFVSGHIDDCGYIKNITPRAESVELQITIAAPLSRLMAEKGSVAIDGVSLTVNTVTAINKQAKPNTSGNNPADSPPPSNDEEGCVISINLIPHTANNTTLLQHQIGDKVNVEADLLARYALRWRGL